MPVKLVDLLIGQLPISRQHDPSRVQVRNSYLYVLPASINAAIRVVKSPAATCAQETLYRNPANCVLNFFVALKSVFLAVSSVVFNISPMVRRRRPW